MLQNLVYLSVLMRQRMMVQRNEGETAESERMPRHRGLNLVVTKLVFHNHHHHRPGGRRNYERPDRCYDPLSIKLAHLW